MKQKRRGRARRPINLIIAIFGVIVIYLSVYTLSYLGKEKLAVYEVSKSSIAESVEGTGVILRKERLVSSEKAGYINYYVKDGSRVKKGGIVYTIDTDGKVQAYLKELLGEKDSVDSEEKAQIFEELGVFGASYKDDDFRAVYETQNDISRSLMEYTDTLLANHKDEVEALCEGNDYLEVATDKEGLVAFSSDGLEELTEEKVSEDTFSDRAKMRELRSDKKKKVGSAAYRFVSGQTWKLMVPVSQDAYEHLKKLKKTQNTVSVTFQKDNFKASAAYDCRKRDGQCYVLLSFDSYVQRYLNQRYLYVEITLSKTEGLKIPSSSLVRKSVYKIPVDYLTNGANTTVQNQVNILKTDKKGRRTLTQETVTIYKKDEEYAYVDAKALKNGTILSDLAKENTYTLKEQTEIQGVFSVNRGYAIFAQIEMLERNEDYCIVSAEDSGIALYDRILLNGDTVKENQVIY